MVATRTWVTGEVVIADHFNTNIRDVLNFLLPVGDPWVTWTPTLTNLTLGNGTVIAKHRVVGKTLDFRFTFTLGSTSAVGTAPDFTLPFAVHADYVEFHTVGGGAALNAGVASYTLAVRRITSTRLDLVNIGTNGLAGTVTATVPFTFGIDDSLFAFGALELA